MNNKKIMAVMGAVVAILLAMLVIYAVSSLLNSGNGPVNIENSGENSSDAFLSSDDETFEPIYEGAAGVEDWDEPTVGDDDGFEGSVVPGSSSTSSSASSSESGSSSANSNSSSGNSSSGGSISGGNTNSGSSSSGSSSSSSSSGSSSGGVTAGSLSYEEYIAMSGEEQQKYFESFESVEAFFEWYNAAKAEYEANREEIEVDGEIDLGDYIGGGNG